MSRVMRLLVVAPSALDAATWSRALSDSSIAVPVNETEPPTTWTHTLSDAAARQPKQSGSMSTIW